MCVCVSMLTNAVPTAGGGGDASGANARHCVRQAASHTLEAADATDRTTLSVCAKVPQTSVVRGASDGVKLESQARSTKPKSISKDSGIVEQRYHIIFRDKVWLRIIGQVATGWGLRKGRRKWPRQEAVFRRPA